MEPHSSRTPRKLTLLIVLFAAAIAMLAMRSVDWALLKPSLRARFRTVQWITTQELGDWLADKNRRPALLLDVRTEEEWNVSHLRGARRIDPGAPTESIVPGLAKDTPIVTYCAIGYRSAEVATRLTAAGFTNVRNLEGSIFEWANERRPLVRDNGRTTQVHPYDHLSGHLLDPDVRAPLPK
jgi:rhodanese-related sulfurtransferase